MTATRQQAHRVRTPRAGAAPRVTADDWNQINWRTAYANVHRLQMRIAKATREGRWGKVFSLQRLLTNSYSGKALAVRRVTTNRGKRTAGVDRILWSSPRQKATAIHDLKRHGYQPRPLRRLYIPKSNGTERPLGIPTMKDRAMQALHLLALQPVAETTGDEHSYGFRPQRSPADAIARSFQLLAKRTSPQWVLEGDIVSCFDRISHEWLTTHVPMDSVVLRKWLKAGYMDRSVFYTTDEGTPQGGIISPVLANLALDGLERMLAEHFPRNPRHKVYMARFADDFVITGATEEILNNKVRPLVERFFTERGLELSPHKTVITHIDTGFDFLGQNVRKYKGKLLIKPSHRSIHLFLAKVRAVIQKNRTAPADALVRQLSPLIRGWSTYHRHIVSNAVFSYVDSAIWQALWRWARRRHPSKGARWVKRKYFPRIGPRDWVFAGTCTNGRKERITLPRASDVPIRRHVLIRGPAHPFDPQWNEYFYRRNRPSGVVLPRPVSGAFAEA